HRMRIKTLRPRCIGWGAGHGEGHVVDKGGHSAPRSGRQLDDALQVAAKLASHYAKMRARCDGKTAGAGFQSVKLGKVHELAGCVTPRARRSRREYRLSQIGDEEIARKFNGSQRDAGGAVFACCVELPVLKLLVEQRS